MASYGSKFKKGWPVKVGWLSIDEWEPLTKNRAVYFGRETLYVIEKVALAAWDITLVDEDLFRQGTYKTKKDAYSNLPKRPHWEMMG